MVFAIIHRGSYCNFLPIVCIFFLHFPLYATILIWFVSIVNHFGNKNANIRYKLKHK